MKTQLVAVPETVMRRHYLAPRTTGKTLIQKIEVPDKFATTDNLLIQFYRFNPQSLPLPCNLASVYLKRKWPDSSVLRLPYTGRFALFIEQDRDELNHFVTLRFNSPCTLQWYWIATSRETIHTPSFFNLRFMQESCQRLVARRRFRTTTATDETLIPLG